jgi:hypothetical protein
MKIKKLVIFYFSLSFSSLPFLWEEKEREKMEDIKPNPFEIIFGLIFHIFSHRKSGQWIDVWTSDPWPLFSCEEEKEERIPRKKITNSFWILLPYPLPSRELSGRHLSDASNGLQEMKKQETH